MKTISGTDVERRDRPACRIDRFPRTCHTYTLASTETRRRPRGGCDAEVSAYTRAGWTRSRANADFHPGGHDPRAFIRVRRTCLLYWYTVPPERVKSLSNDNNTYYVILETIINHCRYALFGGIENVPGRRYKYVIVVIIIVMVSVVVVVVIVARRRCAPAKNDDDGGNAWTYFINGARLRWRRAKCRKYDE